MYPVTEKVAIVTRVIFFFLSGAYLFAEPNGNALGQSLRICYYTLTVSCWFMCYSYSSMIIPNDNFVMHVQTENPDTSVVDREIRLL